MADDLDDFWVHNVAVRPFLGEGAYGPVHGSAAPLLCWVDDKVRLVRNTAGVEVTSSSTLMAPVGTTVLAPRALVTLPSGREAEVITVTVHDSGSLDLLDHVEAALT